MKAFKWIDNKGQAVLIFLLIVAVTLGFGLSIISQSTTDVKISMQEEEASRAFNAAEAGIEEALKSISLGTSTITVDGIDVDYTVSGESYVDGLFEENESVQVLLGGVNNMITIEWVDTNSSIENPGNCSGVTAGSGQTAASLLISVVDSSNNIRRVGLNACDLNSDNGMTNIVTIGTDKYLRSYDLLVSAADSFIRVRPVYNRTSLKVSGAVDLPSQTYLISSTAQVPTLESKAIQVSRTEPATPSVFDYVLFSGTSIVK